jgi:hypothetical protein
MNKTETAPSPKTGPAAIRPWIPSSFEPESSPPHPTTIERLKAGCYLVIKHAAAENDCQPEFITCNSLPAVLALIKKIYGDGE